MDDINQYEHGFEFVFSGILIPYGTPTENCKDIVLDLFWHSLNINLGEHELPFPITCRKKLLMTLMIGKIFLKPSIKELAHKFCSCKMRTKCSILSELTPNTHMN